jgi:type II secretory pathway pseudopilin PulG
MTRFAVALAAGLALACTATAIPAGAQTRSAKTVQSVDQALSDLNSATTQMRLGNAQVQADENTRLRSLRLPEQTATMPEPEHRDRVHENLSTGEPALFDDHKDVRHDTDDLQRNTQE